MDDYTIHVNINLSKAGDRNVAVTKERIWRPLVSLHTWFEKGKTPLPGFIWDAFGLSMITNTAIIVEGVIADLIDEYCVGNNITPAWGTDLDRLTWTGKEQKYNSLFAKKLDSYKGYDAIEILFLFRNNVAHGLAHLEQSSNQEVTNERTDLESINRNYEKIRNFFIQRRLMEVKDVSSNSDQLWRHRNVSYLWFEVKCFLDDVIKENESEFKEGIVGEWKTATEGRG